MFSTIRNIANSVVRLDINDILYDIWSEEDVQEFIIELNTKNQLFERGIDSDERDLGEYAPFTKQIKQDKGLPFDRVTLYDDGDFYESFVIIPTNKGFIIDADTTSKYDKDLLTEWGKEILGLTDESKAKLRRKVVERLKQESKRIFANI